LKRRIPLMNDTSGRSSVHVDAAWGRLIRRSDSGSFIEDRLATLVSGSAGRGRFPVDLVYSEA
jgi:hypothetical protein